MPLSQVPKFDYKFANWSLFGSILSLSDLKDVENDDVEVFYRNLFDKISHAAEQSIPKCRRKSINKKSNAWWCLETDEAVNIKKKSLKFG